MRIGDQDFEVTTDRYQDGWRSHAFLPGGKQRASATCGSREEAEMDLYRRLKDEFAPMPKFDPNRNYAESVVDDLLEAMGRRGFLKRLGLGLAGAAIAPAAMAAAPVAAPVAAAPAAGLANLGPLAGILRMIGDRFVQERTNGWTHPETHAYQPPVPLNMAQARWAAAFPKFRDSLIDAFLTDPAWRRRAHVQADEQWAQQARQDYVRRHGHEPVEDQNTPVADEERRHKEQMRRWREAQKAEDERQRIAADQPAPQQPRKAIQLWPERQPRDRDEEAPWDMESKADKIVGKMLEDEQQDAHVKAYDRVQKWDKAHGTYQKLYPMKLKAMQLFREMGTAIAYERALAHVGLKPEDVAHQIRGAQIGSTHNFKGTRQINACSDAYCSMRGKAQKGDKCAECSNVLEPKQVRYGPSELQYKFPRHIFGVETKDGQCVWFPQPIPPQPEVTDEDVTPQVTAEEREKQKRLGKWW